MGPHCIGLRVLRGQQRTHTCRNGIVFVVFLEFVTSIAYVTEPYLFSYTAFYLLPSTCYHATFYLLPSTYYLINHLKNEEKEG